MNLIKKNLFLFENYPIISEDNLNNCLEIIEKNKDKWDKPFFKDTESYLNFKEIEKVAGQFKSDKVENIIILGTGGSIQTILALKHLSKKKVFPIPSSRAVELSDCLNKTNPSNSIVIPISRGGETLDVNSTIGIFLKRGYKFLGLSSQGTMYKMLKEMNCPILDVPDLSGRFAGSNTNVGIVPAYIAGVDVRKFLKGLNHGYNEFLKIDNNSAITFASFLYLLYKKGYRVVFSMPYSKNLEGSIGLIVQEISESTGKDEKGLMGAFQPAPLCQHSVLEFLLGGSKGIVIPIIWTINNEQPDIILESSIDFINGQTAQTIVNYQADATFQALIEQGVPSAKISIDNPLEENIGILISFIQSSVYFLCLLLDVNWANNPKVVIGKKICNEALITKLSPEERLNKRREIAKQKFQKL